LNMITRRLSRGVVSQCFGETKSKSTLAIVGNPGIGKSWTLIYALQQAMLYENVCVLFVFQHAGMAMVCIRKNHRIYVWTIMDPSLYSVPTSTLFLNSNVLVLLDPIEAKSGGATIIIGNRMLIYAASNNEKHFTSNAIKTMGNYHRNLSPYFDVELLVALCNMQATDDLKKDSLEDMFHRRRMVGNLPRYLLSENSFATRLKITDNSVFKMTSDELKNIINNFAGEVSTSLTLAGSIFSIKALETANSSIGYDGQVGVQYNERVLGFLSKNVNQQVSEQGREFKVSFWGMVGDGELSQLGADIENLFWKDLQNPHCSMIQYKMEKGSKATTFKLRDSVSMPTYIENCKISDLPSYIVYNNSSICRMANKGALIDFAGPGSKVYQVTVSKDHSLKKSGLAELFLALGHVVRNEKKEITLSTNWKLKKKIEYYWVIPKQKINMWKNKNSKTIYTKANDNFTDEEIKCLKHVLDNCVTQYVLIMQSKNIVTDSNLTL
jgi:hypothetical protein